MKKLMAVSTVLFFEALVCSAAADTIYVDLDAVGSDDGTSWSDAYVDLDDALANVSSGDEVWIAEGTYVPDESLIDPSLSSDPRNRTFRFEEGVSYYGGFDGTESSVGARSGGDTVLSGERGTGAITDNVYCVGTLANQNHSLTTNFDRIIFTRGFNDAASSQTILASRPAGLYCKPAGFPLTRNMKVEFLDVVFIDNQTLVVANIANRVSALYIDDFDGSIRDCRFEQNIGSITVNLIDSRTGSSVVGTEFNGNQDGLSSSRLSVSSALRIATGDDFSMDEREFYVSNCKFTGNTFRSIGACIYTGRFSSGCTMGSSDTGKLMIENSLFFDNWSDWGAVVFADFACPMEIDISHCTFTKNIIKLALDDVPSTTYFGLDLGLCAYFGLGNTGLVTNTIAWNNQTIGKTEDIGDFSANGPTGGQYSLQYSLYQYDVIGDTIGGRGSGVLRVDPEFVSILSAELSSTSPCIDSASNTLTHPDRHDFDSDGNTSEMVPIDLNQDPRNVNAVTSDTGVGVPAVDMGCYEYQVWCIADWNRDGITSAADVTAFLAAYASQDPGADLDGNGSWNNFDVSIFNVAYLNGC